MITDTKQRITAYIKLHKQARVHELRQSFKLSRVMIHRHLNNLVLEGVLTKTGASPKVFYQLASVNKPSSSYLWDYDRSELEKTESGRILILERMINYGPGKEKIDLKLVKKYWDKLQLFDLQRKLLQLLIWGKYSSTPVDSSQFWIK